ncbi:hypothetical protein O5O45_06345 [Hahella aquimaris]|uniref:leucine-rich repeat domain-containing protein n=1 Tax=Hahella sp. HNIBRBA332 TaxID=3015983 RepID=UPI00273AD662|nr:leucine-rich repeat domain-containing protein [Hahella sp. HNIBRBA332]WLQ15538.1 hypothetical protein O5O45_06345 [Hahella sp. HNIBRBA332]
MTSKLRKSHRLLLAAVLGGLLSGCGDSAEEEARFQAEIARDDRISALHAACLESPTALEEYRACVQHSRETKTPELGLSRRGEKLPDDLFSGPGLEHITVLSINGNKLTDLPSSLSNLTNLKELRLESNEFTEIPEVVFEMPWLEKMSISMNRISHISDKINNLSSLKSLDLAVNELATLPKSLAGLTRLKYLNLAANRFATIPASIATLPNVEYLSFARNRLEAVPDTVTQMHSLKGLFLKDNHIHILPEQWDGMDRLAVLHLARNSLSTLPISLTHLTQLSQPTEGHIGRLPFDVDNAEGMDYKFEKWGDVEVAHGIDVSNNKFTSLDPAFCQVGWINLENNPLTTEKFNFSCGK